MFASNVQITGYYLVGMLKLLEKNNITQFLNNTLPNSDRRLKVLIVSKHKCTGFFYEHYTTQVTHIRPTQIWSSVLLKVQ